jgi:hypothetical protein
MEISKVAIPNTNLLILDERLSTLCKIYRKGEKHHFAQFYVQTGVLGEAVVKGLEGPNMRFSERKQIHQAMWSYLANVMGYTKGTMQRVKQKPKQTITTISKSLIKYKKVA